MKRLVFLFLLPRGALCAAACSGTSSLPATAPEQAAAQLYVPANQPY